MPERSVPADIPPEAVGFLEQVGYFEEAPLRVGDAVPPLDVIPLDGGESVRIPVPGRPTVLIFGSYT
jgi:hypothetical protein